MNWIAILSTLSGCVIAMIIMSLLGNKKNNVSITKKRKEIKNELEKKTPDELIDDLDNTNDVRTIIDRGRNRFSNRIRKVLSRFRNKGIDKPNN